MIRAWFIVGLLAACGGSTTVHTPSEGGGASAGGQNTGGQDAGGQDTGGQDAGGQAQGGGQGGVGGALSEGCPAEKPSGGPCSPDGLFCDWGGFCNAAQCQDGMWVFPIC